MSTSFEKYSDILLGSFVDNNKAADITQKKKEILDELFDYYNCVPKSILFLGFSPALLGLDIADIAVGEVGPNTLDFLKQQGVEFRHVAQHLLGQEKFDVVVAVDEYLTFVDSDQEQREKVELLSSMTSNFFVTTLRDYKNQDFREREFSQPIVVRNQTGKKIYFEHYDFDQQDRNSCFGTSYCVSDDDVMIIGPFARRSMYFKQLAKFSLDAGASNFLVHKNLMHKSIIKKNYEHIITIRF